MDSTSQAVGQVLDKYLVPFVAGGGLTFLLTYLLVTRKKLPAERRLMESQAASGEVDELEKRVVATVKIVDFYKEDSEDMAERVRQLKRTVRLLEKENGDLKQANALLRDMKSLPPAGD